MQYVSLRKCNILAAVLLLSGCMSQGTASFTPNSDFSANSNTLEARQTITIQGVAAVSGTAMSYAEVTLIDVHYNEEVTEADIDGNFTMTIYLSEFQPPYGLKAKDSFGDLVTSVLVTPPAAGGSQTVNINPLTTAVVAGAVESGNPLDVLTPRKLAAIQSSDVSNSQSALRSVLQNLLSDAQVPSNVDLVSSSFISNHRHLDKLIGELEISASGSSLQLTNLLDPFGPGQLVSVSRGSVLSGALAAHLFNL